MNTDPGDRITIALSDEEAMLVLAALRQFEPYWPGDLDDLARDELLARVRASLEHIRATISWAASSGS
jgi:hypothetical protein